MPATLETEQLLPEQTSCKSKTRTREFFSITSNLYIWETSVSPGIAIGNAPSEVRFCSRPVVIWLTPDPAREFFDPYSYTGGNPINYIDRQGLFRMKPAKGGGYTISQVPEYAKMSENLSQAAFDTRGAGGNPYAGLIKSGAVLLQYFTNKNVTQKLGSSVYNLGSENPLNQEAKMDEKLMKLGVLNFDNPNKVYSANEVSDILGHAETEFGDGKVKDFFNDDGKLLELENVED